MLCDTPVGHKFLIKNNFIFSPLLLGSCERSDEASACVDAIGGVLGKSTNRW